MRHNSYTPTTYALLRNLAIRCRAARRAHRRALKQGVTAREVLAELDGRSREAWNSYQAAKQLVAEQISTTEDRLDELPAEATPPHPVQPLIVDRGQLRFKPNAIVQFLLDAGPFDMNTLAVKQFTREDREQFTQLIGYSHGGAGDLSYFSNAAWDSALQAHKAGADSWQALAQVSQSELETFKKAMREPIAALYRVHPSDLR